MASRRIQKELQDLQRKSSGIMQCRTCGRRPVSLASHNNRSFKQSLCWGEFSLLPFISLLTIHLSLPWSTFKPRFTIPTSIQMAASASTS
ncbi:hypothetical protein BHE74_00001554 [Ensete ventricosum]|uniref:Uncharacterized protein n=2 Tax=Ensete ventricosum TaxID=4639 RepID=A0A427B8T4_ENSVE|nr:hypothetical protein B296_00000713 [Ensete ventricosum]RWW89499.1 hypothetical protein BHE74_00001554 [Ensete ventricosum]